MGNGESGKSIFYLKQREIDKTKWDECITRSGEGTIYNRSFYLDVMSRHWDALVMCKGRPTENDYEAVMPLPWNKKYGFYYLYQPHFLRHVGIFGNSVTTELVNAFISSIPKYFKYWDIDLKEDLISPNMFSLPHLKINKRRNFFLSLDKNYEEINNSYKRLAHRMIKKANEKHIEVIRNSAPEEVINFYKKNYKSKQKEISDLDYERLVVAADIAFDNKSAITYLAKLNGNIVAAYLVLKDNNFVYSLIGGSNETGKEFGAFYLLTDAAIKDHAESNLIFRFEGSDKKGIVLFNSQFHPVPIDYFGLKSNNLPWWIKWMKK